MNLSTILNQYVLIKISYLIIVGIICSNFQSCTSKQSSLSEKVKTDLHKKPSSNFQDTLIIESRSAVFYEPDSLQLYKIKSITDSRIFESSMHEYYYQIKTARIALQRNWPHIKIIDAKNVRYLACKNADNTINYIDLDSFGDAYGMFIFETGKTPVPVDMTNVEDAVYFYFSK